MFDVLIKSVAVVLGLLAVGIGGTVFVTILWARHAVKGKLFVYVLEPTKRISTHLVNVGNDDFFELGTGPKKQTYIVSPRKQFWTMWPPMLPMWARETVPAAIYVRNMSEPIDPYSQEALVTGTSLRVMRDEAMLKTLWKDVQGSLGLKGKSADRMPFILSLVAILLTGITLYLVWSLSGKVADVAERLGTLGY